MLFFLKNVEVHEYRSVNNFYTIKIDNSFLRYLNLLFSVRPKC